MVCFHSKQLEYCKSDEEKEVLEVFVYSLTRKGKEIQIFVGKECTCGFMVYIVCPSYTSRR